MTSPADGEKIMLHTASHRQFLNTIIRLSKLNHVILLSLMCLLAGCATLNVSKLPPNARYTVITHFSDGIYYEEIGLTIFNDNFRTQYDASDVSTPIKNRIVEVLGGDSAKQYVPLNFSFTPPAWMGDPDTYVSNVKADCNLSNQDKVRLSAIAKTENLNLIIFVCDDAYSNPYQSLPGRGLSFRQTFNIKLYMTYFNYSIFAYDPTTWDFASYSSLSERRYKEFAWPSKNSTMPDEIKIAVKQEVDSYSPPSDVGFGLCYMKLTNSGQQYLDQVRATECNIKYPFGREVGNGLPITWFPQLQWVPKTKQ